MNSFTEAVFALMEDSGFDKETSEAILNEFREQTIRLLNDIKKDITEDKFKEVGLILHQLKGTAGNVRAKEIAKRALEAEEALKMMNKELLGCLLQRIEELLEEFNEV